MKLTELHVVEGDPERGGCHIKSMAAVLELNRRAFVEGNPRGMVVLDAQPTLEQAQAAERELKRERKENFTAEGAEGAESGGIGRNRAESGGIGRKTIGISPRRYEDHEENGINGDHAQRRRGVGMIMKEKPILFNGEMVRAVLEGRKTQTRRVVKNLDLIQDWDEHDKTYGPYFQDEYGDHHKTSSRSPYGQPGDRLWVRETFCLMIPDIEIAPKSKPFTLFRADDDGSAWYRNNRWKPSIFMPRKFSRILLEVVDVRVERVQYISGADVLAEGVDNGKSNPTMGVRWENMQRMAFEELWDSINGEPRKDGVDVSWAANPWVWVVEFKVIDAPDGQAGKPAPHGGFEDA